MRIAPKITALGLAALSLACGKERYAHPGAWGHRLEQREDQETGSGTGPGTGSGPGADTGTGSSDRPPAADPNAPLETLLQGGLILPERLKAETLTISFKANAPGARFECLLGTSSSYEPCDGSSYAFGRLNHAQSYALKVRARTPDGRVDATPLEVSFVVDLLTGQAPLLLPTTDDVDAKIPEAASDLPQAGKSASTAGRALQVGSYFAVVAPVDQQVTSYATNKNYALTQRYFRLMPSPVPCTGTFEEVVAGAQGSGTSYCEATPNAAEWQTKYSNLTKPVPKNHVEMVRPSAQGIEERLEVAAFDDDQDPAEARLGLGAVCQNANYQGETQVGLLTTFYGDVTRQLFRWCQAKDEKGEWWWIGSFAAVVSRNPNPARLTVTYAVNVRQGLFSGQQFSAYAERRLPSLIIPIALPSGTH